MALKRPSPWRSPRPQPYAASLEAAAKQNSHVDELIVKNRTLEHTVEKLKSALHQEEVRCKDVIQKVQQKWTTEREEWREGCDALQNAHRVAHLNTTVELDKERLELLKERNRGRKERLKLLQRDFRLTMFQIQDSDRERRIRELENELQQVQWHHERELQEVEKRMEGQVLELRKGVTQLEAQLAETSDELHALQTEKTQIETTLTGLRSEHAKVLASATSKSKELERTALSAESLKTTYDNLKNEHQDLQKKHLDATRQVEKLTNTERRDQAELEELREQKVQLEISMQALENQLEATQNTELEGMHAKLAKWKKSVEEHRISLAEAHEAASRNEAEAEQSRIHLDAANKELKKLRKQLEAERTKRTALTNAPHRNATLSPIPGSDVEPAEPPDSEPEQPKARSKAKPPSRGGRRTQSEDQHIELEEASRAPPPPKSKYKRRTDDDSGVADEAPAAARKPRSRKQATPAESAGAGPSELKPKPKRGRSKKSPEVTASDLEVVQVLTSPAKRLKGKAPQIIVEDTEEDEEEILAAPLKRKRKKPHDEDDDGRKSVDPVAKAQGRPPKVKPPSRQSGVTRPVSRLVDSDEETGTVAQPKKKRKINLFPAAQPQTFDWGNLAQGGGGLNIPTDLSPVKDNDAVPPRSTSRLGSVFGSFSQSSRR